MNSEILTIDELMERAGKDIERKLVYCIPIFILAVITPILAWYSFVIPETEEPAIWFQRSGSLTVLFAVWMEYNLMKVNEHVFPSGHTFSQQAALAKKYQPIFKVAQYMAVLLAIMGTVIWGYGDLFK
ncbi:hypothetical protein LRP50_18690 [Enterovibrio sp. ZSDZ42]|uniref:Uncharacterized protein n=1 Tax=Enterovibrio gelatinilyticus TaxID=2899819 RepID=A0ABT5R5N6_9GAMM|nr:hypothetical protein [Enterovibrio sp. ZSDZ42]MDD1795160.1 hypothetical protein [Enterovibrio sp. ZSDZ42]